MRRILFIALALASTTTFAQVTDAEKDLKTQSTDTLEGWKNGGAVSINFSQLSLSNWAAGGLNSINVNSFFSYYANYTKGDISWDNSFDLGFGIVRQGDDQAPWVKSDDKLDFTSKFGKKASDKLYYAGLLNFRTQFVEGYETPARANLISNFLAPGYLLTALGVDYKPSDKLSLFIAPVTHKSTIVMDEFLSDAGAFGVDMGSTMRSEFGGYLRVQFKSDIAKNINYTTRLDLFSNYMNNPENIDVNWENILTMKVNEFISANFMTHMIYDDDIKVAVDRDGDGITEGTGTRLQFKQLFGAGFSYKF
jgi:hypothetical protein